MTLVIGMLILGTFMGDIENNALKGNAYTTHKLVGLLILALGGVFLLWSSLNRKPGYPIDMPKREKCLARFVHLLLYAMLLAMPLSGWIMSSAAGRHPSFFGMFQIPMPFLAQSKSLAQTAGDLHYYFAWGFFWLILLHFVGAMKHHLLDKNNLLKRMFH